MATQVIPFAFENCEVRTLLIDDQPWFCASDVCSALEYANGRQAIQKSCREKGVSIRDTLTSGGPQKLTFIDEGNLYRLILKSRKKAALRFEEWVCDEVLPQIRKTGQYQMGLSDQAIGADGMSILSSLVNGKISHLKGKQRASAKARFWNQIHAGFDVVCGADIPESEFNNVRQFIGEYVLEGDYLPADQKQLPLDDGVPEYHYQEFGKTFHDGQLILKELTKFVPQDAQMLLKQLDAVLVSGWTVMDESLMRLNMTRSMLSKWRGEPMGHIQHRL